MTVHVNEFSSDPTLITRGPNPSSLEPLEIGEELSMCRGAILWEEIRSGYWNQLVVPAMPARVDLCLEQGGSSWDGCLRTEHLGHGDVTESQSRNTVHPSIFLRTFIGPINPISFGRCKHVPSGVNVYPAVLIMLSMLPPVFDTSRLSSKCNEGFLDYGWDAGDSACNGFSF